MKKGILKWIVMIMILVMCMPQVFALSQIRVRVNGSQVYFPDGQPFADANSRVMVPIRFISEQLGAEVKWDKDAQRVTILDSDKEIMLKIGNKEVMVNGKVKELDTAAVLKNSRTYVPLRFVSEALGATVTWDSKVRIVYINNGRDPLPEQKVYTAGPFNFVIDPDWQVSETKDSWKIKTETLLRISVSETGMSLGNYMTLILSQGMIVPYSEQCDEAEQILQQVFSESKAKEIVAYARKKQGRKDALPDKKFYEGNYVVIVGGERATVNIDVNKK